MELCELDVALCKKNHVIEFVDRFFSTNQLSCNLLMSHFKQAYSKYLIITVF